MKQPVCIYILAREHNKAGRIPFFEDCCDERLTAFSHMVTISTSGQLVSCERVLINQSPKIGVDSQYGEGWYPLTF